MNQTFDLIKKNRLFNIYKVTTDNLIGFGLPQTTQRLMAFF